MSSSFGDSVRISIFGESHGEAIGVVLDNLPAGCSIDEEQRAARRGAIWPPPPAVRVTVSALSAGC